MRATILSFLVGVASRDGSTHFLSELSVTIFQKVLLLCCGVIMTLTHAVIRAVCHETTLLCKFNHSSSETETTTDIPAPPTTPSTCETTPTDHTHCFTLSLGDG